MLVVAAAGSSSGATIMKAKSAIIAAALPGPNPKQRLLLACDWASVRKSPDVDAYVLAWIANQARFHSPQSNYNSCPGPINLATTAAHWSSRLVAIASSTIEGLTSDVVCVAKRLVINKPRESGRTA
jgi:hypothetical protein